MDNIKIAQAISSLRGKSPQEAVEILSGNWLLSQEERSIAYTLGSYQQYLLQDGDLARGIMEHRQKTYGHIRGSLNEDLGEISWILKAFLSPQYRKFIKHMMISYNDHTKLFPVEGVGAEECGICHKKLYQYSGWVGICQSNPSFGEQDRKEYLCIGSSESSVPICTNCLIQLKAAYGLLEHIDPGFLFKI